MPLDHVCGPEDNILWLFALALPGHNIILVSLPNISAVFSLGSIC